MAKLYARVHTGTLDGRGKTKFSWRPVEFAGNGKPLPPERWNPPQDSRTISSYTTRIKGKFDRHTRCKNLADAIIAMKRAEIDPSYSAPALIQDFKNNSSDPKLLESAAKTYLAELSVFGKSKATQDKYSDAVNDFVGVCTTRGTLLVQNVSRGDIVAYIAWLQDESNMPRRKYGSRDTTIANRLRFLGTFLTSVGIKMKKDRNPRPDDPGLLARHEVPRAPKSKGRKYSRSEVRAMLKACQTVDETDLIQFFVFTGFRDSEVAYSEWSDINFSSETINVNEKPHYGWRPKDRESRECDISLPAKFVQRMEDRRERLKAANDALIAEGKTLKNPDCNLIFPTPKGTPDTNLIKIIYRVAERAKIEGRIGLKAFRRTFLSNTNQKQGLDMARALGGHADDKTTSEFYIVVDEEDEERARAAAARTYEEYVEAEAEKLKPLPV